MSAPPHPAVVTLTQLALSIDFVLARQHRAREGLSLRRGVVADWLHQVQDALQQVQVDQTVDAARQADEARQRLRGEITATLTAVRIYESLLLDLRERLSQRQP
jgi:hypothetical protein